MKQLKVGDRIRLEGVVNRVYEGNFSTPVRVILNGSTQETSLTQAEADRCEIISEAKPEPDKWEVGQTVEDYDNLEDQWNRVVIIAIDGGDVWVHHEDYPNMAYRSRLSAIRPIPPKPVTLSDELQDLLFHTNVSPVQFHAILDLITKHTSLKMPSEVTDEEIDFKFQQYVGDNIYNRVRALVRHFLKLQRGGRG